MEEMEKEELQMEDEDYFEDYHPTIAIDSDRTVVEFLKELRTNGHTFLYRWDDWGFELSDELLLEFNNMGITIYKINFSLYSSGEGEEYFIYCLNGYEKESIEWILEVGGIDPECLAFKELRNEYPYVKCRWNSTDDSHTFVVPVGLLKSISIENYPKGNVLRNIEVINVD